jgi:hypothetical protein
MVHTFFVFCTKNEKCAPYIFECSDFCCVALFVHIFFFVNFVDQGVMRYYIHKNRKNVWHSIQIMAAPFLFSVPFLFRCSMNFLIYYCADERPEQNLLLKYCTFYYSLFLTLFTFILHFPLNFSFLSASPVLLHCSTFYFRVFSFFLCFYSFHFFFTFSFSAVLLLSYYLLSSNLYVSSYPSFYCSSSSSPFFLSSPSLLPLFFSLSSRSPLSSSSSPRFPPFFLLSFPLNCVSPQTPI